MTKIVLTTKARQGYWGRHALIVLIVGLILALVAWAAAEFYGEAIDPLGGTNSLGATHEQSAKEAVAAASKRFTDTYATKDASDLASFYTKDASAFPPDMAQVEGRENIEKMWQGVMDMGVTDLTRTTKKVEENGTLATESGTFSFKAPGKDGKAADATGDYVVVWVMREGIWKMYRDTWNSDPAPRPTQAATQSEVQD